MFAPELIEVLLYIHVGGFAAAGLVVLLWMFMRVWWERSPGDETETLEAGGTQALALWVSCYTYATVLSVGALAPWARWVGYSLACPLFIYEMARVLGRTRTRAALAAGFMFLTIFIGALIYFIQTPANPELRWLVFGGGGLSYVVSLAFAVLDDRLRLPPMASIDFWYAAALTLVWSAYPFFYVFGPAMAGYLSADAELLAYFILEFPAKYGVAATNVLLVERGHGRPSLVRRVRP